jgi:tRNA threonylcarbamoyladenosine biosynthesis protein TsaB
MIAQALAETSAPRAAVLHDARRGEVYFALGSADGLAVNPCLLAFEDAIEEIRRRSRDRRGPLAFAGTAGEAACERYREAGGNGILSAVRLPDALWVARLARLRPAAEAAPRPLYLRPPDAKLPERT